MLSISPRKQQRIGFLKIAAGMQNKIGELFLPHMKNVEEYG